jgi:hypothetical protein
MTVALLLLQRISSSNALTICFGHALGAMNTASARHVLSPAHSLRESQVRTAREKR